MMRMKRDFPLQIKAVTDAGEFSGYGSVFGVEDSYGDVVVKGAFERSLDEWDQKNRKPSMLWQHDIAEPIGIYTKIEEDDNGLYVEGRLLIDDDPLAKRAHAHLKAGSLSGMSIGYNLYEDGWEYDTEKDVFILKAIDLWEVSLVTFPANDEARVEQVKRACIAGIIPKQKTVERCLREVGFTVQQAKGIMAKGYSGISLREVDDDVEQAKSLINKIRGN